MFELKAGILARFCSQTEWSMQHQTQLTVKDEPDLLDKTSSSADPSSVFDGFKTHRLLSVLKSFCCARLPEIIDFRLINTVEAGLPQTGLFIHFTQWAVGQRSEVNAVLFCEKLRSG